MDDHRKVYQIPYPHFWLNRLNKNSNMQMWSFYIWSLSSVFIIHKILKVEYTSIWLYYYLYWLGKQILSYSKLGIHIKSAYFSCQDVIHFLRQVEKMVIRGANFSSKTSGKDIVYTISIMSMNKMVVYISLKTFQRQFLLFIWVIFNEWWASKICLPEIPNEM